MCTLMLLVSQCCFVAVCVVEFLTQTGKIDNPSCQMKRMQELPHLYCQCYDKPFVPPYKIQQELLRVSGGNGLPAQKSQVHVHG